MTKKASRTTNTDRVSSLSECYRLVLTGPASADGTATGAASGRQGGCLLRLSDSWLPAARCVFVFPAPCRTPLVRCGQHKTFQCSKQVQSRCTGRSSAGHGTGRAIGCGRACTYMYDPWVAGMHGATYRQVPGGTYWGPRVFAGVKQSERAKGRVVVVIHSLEVAARAYMDRITCVF